MNKKLIKEVRDNIDFIVFGTCSKTVAEAVKAIENSSEYQQCVADEFGVDYSLVLQLLKDGAATQADFEKSIA